MGFSFGGNKQKQSSQTSENFNQSSTFNPNQQFLNMTQGGLNQALGLIGNYGTTGQADVENYLNPRQDVINANLARQAAVAGNSVDAQAAAAGAFGGTGWGLLRGETNRGFADASALSAAQGYDTALQAAMGERANSAQFDMNALQTYLSGLGLLGNWGTTNTSGTSSGTSSGKSSGMNFGIAGRL